MADYCRFDNDSGFDGSVETDLSEMLAAAARGGLDKNAAHRPDLGIEIAFQRGFTAVAQAASAIFDDVARDLGHAGSRRAGAY